MWHSGLSCRGRDFARFILGHGMLLYFTKSQSGIKMQATKGVREKRELRGENLLVEDLNRLNWLSISSQNKANLPVLARLGLNSNLHVTVGNGNWPSLYVRSLSLLNPYLFVFRIIASHIRDIYLLYRNIKPNVLFYYYKTLVCYY